MMMKLVMAGLLAALPMVAFGADNGASEGQFASQMTSSTLTMRQMDELTKRLVAMPDPELAVVLPASTFPVEIVVAERWMEAHPKATGEDIDGQIWPDPVKALAHNAAALKMMSDDLEWTQALGKTFLAEGDDMLRTVQRNRSDAQRDGTLRAVEGQMVTRANGAVVIWPEMVGTPVVEPVVVGANYANYGFGSSAVYGGNYGCDWGNYVIVDSAGVDWRSRLGAGIGRERGGAVTIVNGVGVVPFGVAVVVGRGYGGVVAYNPGYTGNVIITSGPQTLYSAPTFQRTGYSFTPTLLVSPGFRGFDGRRR